MKTGNLEQSIRRSPNARERIFDDCCLQPRSIRMIKAKLHPPRSQGSSVPSCLEATTYFCKVASRVRNTRTPCAEEDGERKALQVFPFCLLTPGFWNEGSTASLGETLGNKAPWKVTIKLSTENEVKWSFTESHGTLCEMDIISGWAGNLQECQNHTALYKWVYVHFMEQKHLGIVHELWLASSFPTLRCLK